MTDRGRPRKIERRLGQLELNTEAAFKVLERSDEARDLTLALFHRRPSTDQWRGFIAIPPDSLIEKVIEEFRHKTNIPLEIPFFTFLSILSGYLLCEGVSINILGFPRIYPDIWNIILALSGAGKTYTEDTISRALSRVMGQIEFPGTGLVSGAAFISELTKKPRGLWIRDEFAQFIKSIEFGGPLSDMKDYLLRLYNNRKIERSTKKESITQLIDPALTILGLSVLDTFYKHVPIEMMLDGFAQRFGIVIAKADASRLWRDYPLWDVDCSTWDSRWVTMTTNLHKEYFASKVGLEAFSSTFNALFNDKLPESFYRRVLWRAHKYALMYHVLRADPSCYLTAEDYGWAARVISMQLDDMAYLVGEHNISPLERMIKSAERIGQKVNNNGKELTTRDLIQGVSSITNVQQAKTILEMVNSKRKI
jgi:hypothetical protein